MTTSPSLDEFLTTARREFGFLVAEFGFTEQPDTRAHLNPFCVCYASPGASVTVDGIQWGFGVQVLLSAPGGQPTAPLWALAEARGIQHQVLSGQLAQLASDAELLRRVADDILRGGSSAFAAALDVVEQHAATAAKREAGKQAP